MKLITKTYTKNCFQIRPLLYTTADRKFIDNSLINHEQKNGKTKQKNKPNCLSAIY